jgi:GNAT superfamily N-acetyltransferase
MFHLFKSSKVAPAPPPLPPPPKLEIRIWPRENAIWGQFADYVEATNETVDYTNPGPLATELAELCERKGAYELDSTKIMYFSEPTNYFLELTRNGERVGFLLLEAYNDRMPAKIWLVCVSSSEKGKNYSKLLIDQAKEIARSLGKGQIELEAITREVGRKVYRPLGFDFISLDDLDMTAELSLGSNGTRKKRSRKNRKTNRATKRR